MNPRHTLLQAADAYNSGRRARLMQQPLQPPEDLSPKMAGIWMRAWISADRDIAEEVARQMEAHERSTSLPMRLLGWVKGLLK